MKENIPAVDAIEIPSSHDKYNDGDNTQERNESQALAESRCKHVIFCKAKIQIPRSDTPTVKLRTTLMSFYNLLWFLRLFETRALPLMLKLLNGYFTV